MDGKLVPARKTEPAAPARRPTPAPRSMGVAGSMTFAAIIVVLFLGGFGAWAALAPLESAAIAPGVLEVSGERKTVQHLEGGIVAKIAIAEGDSVTAGQTLLVLDATQPRAVLAQAAGQRRSAAALEARLVAERDGLDSIDWPEWLRAVDAEAVRATQDRIFAARKASFDSEVAILEQRIAQLHEQAAGFEGQVAAQDRHVALLAEEIDDIRPLVEKGHATRQRLRALEREAAEITGERARNRAQVARMKEAASEVRLQIVRLRNTRRTEVTSELREVEARLADLNQRLTAAQDVLERTRIVAPVAGTVVGLGVFTPGAVIAPGQKLLDIVPLGERLVAGHAVDAVVAREQVYPVGLHHVRAVQIAVLAMLEAYDRVFAQLPIYVLEQRSQEQFRSGAAACNDDPLVPREVRSRKRGGGDALKADGDGAMEDRPCRREAHGAAAALEQPNPDLPLKFRNVAADSGLVDPQFFGGADEACMARGGVERPQGAHAGQRSGGMFQHDGIKIPSRTIPVSRLYNKFAIDSRPIMRFTNRPRFSTNVRRGCHGQGIDSVHRLRLLWTGGGRRARSNDIAGSL